MLTTPSKIVFAVFSILVLGIPVVQAINKELLIANGQPMLLELSKTDIRSVMQVEYFQLRYIVTKSLGSQKAPRRGAVVVTLDENKIARYSSVFDQNISLTDDVFRLNYRFKKGAYLIGAKDYALSEETKENMKKAKYADIRAANDGQAILIGFRDEDLNPL